MLSELCICDAVSSRAPSSSPISLTLSPSTSSTFPHTHADLPFFCLLSCLSCPNRHISTYPLSVYYLYADVFIHVDCIDSWHINAFKFATVTRVRYSRSDLVHKCYTNMHVFVFMRVSVAGVWVWVWVYTFCVQRVYSSVDCWSSCPHTVLRTHAFLDPSNRFKCSYMEMGFVTMRVFVNSN